MTHTLHRIIGSSEQDQDWILICKAANGVNDFGAAEKLRLFLRMSCVTALSIVAMDGVAVFICMNLIRFL
jgi:hypothetical protein